jgi:hypothetical protein
MASLQVLKFAGAFPGADLSIPDGPPVASKTISGAGTVYGSDGAAVICFLSPIGGDATITWPGGVVEILTASRACGLRGESVSVA